MQAIWKYELAVADEQVISMPFGARILCVQMQRDRPCVWALCDTDTQLTEDRSIRIIGTGHPISRSPGEYIGTFQIDGGALIFHAFAS